jgi:hypothetical protein
MITEQQVNKVVNALLERGLETEAKVVQEMHLEERKQRLRALAMMDARDHWKRQYEIATNTVAPSDV